MGLGGRPGLGSGDRRGRREKMQVAERSPPCLLAGRSLRGGDGLPETVREDLPEKVRVVRCERAGEGR